MPIEFQSNRLLFREIQSDDIPLIHKMNSFEEVARFNTIGIPDDISDTLEIHRPILEDHDKDSRSRYMWLIREKESLEFIGEIGLNLSSAKYRSGEFHYSLMPEQWGKGYATEAVQKIIEFCFDVLDLHRITAGVATGNLASIRVLEKAGLVREGTGRKILPIRGRWYDNYNYSILASDQRNYLAGA